MTYTKTVILPVLPDEAFALITEPARLRRWQAVCARVDLRVGGEYRWTITPGHTAAGEYREIEPGRRVVFGWGWDGDSELPPDASTVTITLEPVEGGTQVTLQHEGLSDEQAARHAAGWEHYVARLAAAAADGDAGPDAWAATPDPMDPLSAAEATLALLQPVLLGLTNEDKVKQTPCAEFDCHGLAEHLFSSLTQLGAMAGVEVRNPEEGSLENRVAAMAATALEGWRTRGLEGTVSVGGGEMPASAAAAIIPVELLLHAWDFAVTSGQSVPVSDELVAYVHGLAEMIVPGGRPRGAFAEEVPADAEATPLERLAAYSGRSVAA